jgi:hypothetical protein
MKASPGSHERFWPRETQVTEPVQKRDSERGGGGNPASPTTASAEFTAKENPEENPRECDPG